MQLILLQKILLNINEVDMEMEAWTVLLGWILFAGTHIGLSTNSIRSGLTGKIGEKGFQGLYSLIALITFGLLIAAFYYTKSPAVSVSVPSGNHPALQHTSSVLMLFAFILLFTGFRDRTPMGMVPVKAEARGIVRVTRHPMNMAFALFGLAHLLTSHIAAEWFFYGGFVLYGYFGSAHQDQKKVRVGGEELSGFVAETSIFPFGAIIKGKQPFKLGEISKIGLLLGIVATVVVRYLHPGF